ncbi:hypothetical protein ACJX0J_031063, partial [Zea mays]
LLPGGTPWAAHLSVHLWVEGGSAIGVNLGISLGTNEGQIANSLEEEVFSGTIMGFMTLRNIATSMLNLICEIRMMALNGQFTFGHKTGTKGLLEGDSNTKYFHL